jgi:photosystem II stability/assembly factor-like uncharacterized protein
MHMKFNCYTAAAFLFLALAARAQTTAFTYQGQLNSSNLAVTGTYDFRFRVFDANSNVVAGPLTNAPVGVTNGLFTVVLNFGTGVFTGSSRALEIAVRGYGDTNAYTALSPWQTLTSVPYAIQAINASNAVVLTAPLQATNLAGTVPNSLLSPNVAILTNNVIFSGSVTATNFTGNGYGLSNVPGTSLVGIITGNGSGLTNVPANYLTGTLRDERLSTNVALQSNTNLYFAGSVTASNFTGAGHGLTNVPGAFFWVTVSNLSTQIFPNIGYIATNNTAPVTLTLPSLPSVGDVYKVAGVGAGGWIIAQNANQMIAAGNLAGSIGQNWQISGPGTANWSSVAASADGTKIAATINGGYIYVSTNSGVTWLPRNSSQGSLNYSDVAVSADGNRMVATVGSTSTSGYIWTSTDSGADWTTQSSSSGSKQWVSIASSADGTKLVAAVYGGYLYVSSNSGQSWPAVGTAVPGSLYWSSVASSADGTKLVAVATSGQIYTSTNSGSTWLLRTNNVSLPWNTVASSSDGSRLVAALGNGSIYISTDSGVTWTANSTTTASGSSVASSSDGNRLAAVYGSTIVSGYIYTSTDSGASWTMAGNAPSAKWMGVASSSDGSLLAAVAYGGNIYVSSQASTTPGTAGYLSGAQHTAIELIYAGNNLFLPLSHEGTIRAY